MAVDNDKINGVRRALTGIQLSVHSKVVNHVEVLEKRVPEGPLVGSVVLLRARVLAALLAANDEFGIIDEE